MLRIALTVCVLLTSTSLYSDDWPQWMGPGRDGRWEETEIIREIPSSGLPVKWRVPVAWGYSGPAVVAGKVYVTDYVHESGEVTNDPGTPDELIGKERVLCLDADTGKQIWKFEYACPYKMSYPKGPRATPTFAQRRLFVLGAAGRFTCLDAQSGTEQWHHELTTEYNVETPIWGFAAHPLVDGDRVYAVVGGEGSVAVAWDVASGREIWRALSADTPGYCPLR